MPRDRPPAFLDTDALAVGELWTAMPYADAPRFTGASLQPSWARLHIGQGVALAPPGVDLWEGWALYHSGEFAQAVGHGRRHGADGIALVNQATAVYADYLEPREAVRLQLFNEVAQRAAARLQTHSDDCHALYWQAYALGRYAQGVSVARALAQGLGQKVKHALEQVIALHSDHADAMIALASFHAEVIDKVGPLVGRMTHGARVDSALELFERGLKLLPESPGALMEYARCLLMLEGDGAITQATRLYEKAAALQPLDARQRLDIELAKAGLAD